eukprot:TRINITY_DN5759_c0_g1_i2.p2 TRINITY_DN5759_c0_g1~~TRINITY_DN5759_c0_g1_i2.p2  ORF type:complete len:482 (-),score=141.89 TRINITY_DN5759_c0_g1_i2:3021-4466(-)
MREKMEQQDEKQPPLNGEQTNPTTNCETNGNEEDTKNEEMKLKSIQETQMQPRTSITINDKAEDSNDTGNVSVNNDPIPTDTITPTTPSIEPIPFSHSPSENVPTKPQLKPLKLNTAIPTAQHSPPNFSQTLPASLHSHTSSPQYNSLPFSNTFTFSPVVGSKSPELSKVPSSPSRGLPHTSLSTPSLMPSYSQSPPGSPTLRPARMPPLQTSSSLPLPPRTLFNNPYSNSRASSPTLSPSSHRSSTPLSAYRDSGSDDVLGDQASESEREYGGFSSTPATPSQQTTTNLQALAPFVTVLKAPQSSDNDRADCFEKLINLAESNSNKILMVKAGVLEPLVHFLSTGTPTLKSQSTNLTRLLSRCEENKELMVQAGVLEPLVKILSGTGDLSFDENSKINAAGAISNLGFRLENKLTMVKAGALELLIDLIKNGKPQAQEYAVLALYNLTHKNEQAKSQLFQTPFLPVLVELLRKGTYEAKI